MITNCRKWHPSAAAAGFLGDQVQIYLDLPTPDQFLKGIFTQNQPKSDQELPNNVRTIS